MFGKTLSDKKCYSFLILSPKAAKVNRITIAPPLLNVLAVFLSFAFLLYAYILYDYMMNRRNIVELQKLRIDTLSQRTELGHLGEKIATMEEQAHKVQTMEKQAIKELGEVKELKKTTKVTPVTKKAHLLTNKEPSFSAEQAFILDRERSRLISHLHQRLLELRKKALQREQNLKELQGLIGAQKSILLSTPSLWPVLGRITSGFGETRQIDASGGTRPHRAVDIAAPVGTPILAPAEGIVRFAGWGQEYGRLVCIDHGYGFSTIYGHLQNFFVKTGTRVRKGEAIGTVGVSGNTNGPHLHYEVCLRGSRVDPFPYLTQLP
ncbi:MAG: peptidoglycan DD-metalloendopeptidase family protein [Deltaproteobacteria bacterium]|nr:peptidoglycan DD-metalloendopeptidase family protein [Deltaproteobacteria bacterium]